METEVDVFVAVELVVDYSTLLYADLVVSTRMGHSLRVNQLHFKNLACNLTAIFGNQLELVDAREQHSLEDQPTLNALLTEYIKLSPFHSIEMVNWQQNLDFLLLRIAKSDHTQQRILPIGLQHTFIVIFVQLTQDCLAVGEISSEVYFV